ncbi:MAG: SOS response-associated peptidase [Chloroflexota bacterium]|nr:SOS response-associated peptidase [Chloroflexota bacterium]
MCGRYSLIADIQDLARQFEFDGTGFENSPRYNVAPTQSVLTVTNRDERQGEFMRWGLIPSWAKDASIGSRMINARGETVAQKPSFRNALQRRRCLVLADGFYEWQKVGKGKRPMRIVLKSREPFAFAGLWETWRNPEGETVRSCTIITTEANDLLRPIHERMPVILPRELEEFWLDGDVDDSAALSDVLAPYPDGSMEVYEVSTLVNKATNSGPDLIVPVGGGLFG